ncbi:MAG TPA: AsmA-like C-terminal region-containing protein [Nitrospira sp.]|nr:AsmA-like C-terminal region-containing protein [Nitrospira sp.]
MLLGVVSGLLWLRVESAAVRQWVADNISAAVGKRVTIGGPVTWSLSLEPAILLQQVAVAEQAERGSSDFVKAGTIEVSIALLPLLRRTIVISTLSISDLEVRFKKESGDKTGRTPAAQADISDAANAQPAVQIHTISLHRATAIVQGSSSTERERVIIDEARLDAAPDRPVRLVASGAFRSVPVTLDATGGPWSDLIDGRTEWWPLSLTVQIPEVDFEAEGRIGLPVSTSRFDGQLTLTARRLNALNTLFAVEWPALGPAALSGQVKLEEGHMSASDMRATVGTSDLSGELSVQYTGRQRLSAHLASQRIDAGDFSSPDNMAVSTGSVESSEDISFLVEWLKVWDVDLTMTSESLVVGGRVVGPLRVQCTAETGSLHISVPEARMDGMRVNGHADIDVHGKAPALSLAFNARGFDPSLVFSSLSDDVAGISDVAFRVEARGATKGEFLRSMTVSLRTSRATLLLREPLSERDVPLSLDDGDARLDASGGRMRVSGRYGSRLFHFEATTGALAALSSGEAWPIGLRLRTGHAHLLVQGTIRLPLKHESMALEIRGDGQRLDELASSLPAIGPFRLSGRVTGAPRQSWAGNVAWQVGKSDGQGRFDVAAQDDRVVLTAEVESHSIRPIDFNDHVDGGRTAGNAASNAGNLEIPVPPKNLSAHVTWHIDRFQADRLNLRQFLLKVSAEEGRLDVSSSAVHPHGRITASLVLDDTDAIPKLHAHAHSKDFNYGALLRELEVMDRVTGTTDVLLDLTSEGHTIEELRDGIAFHVTAQPHTWRLSASNNDAIPISLSTVTLSSRRHAPVMLSVHGAARNLPLSMTITSVPVTEFLAVPAHLPWNLVLQGPGTVLHAQGRTGFAVARGTADFRLRFKGASLSTIAGVFGKDIPGLAPYEFDGNVTVRDHRVTLSDFRATMGKSDIEGGMHIAFTGPRPRFTGTFASEFIEPKVLEQLSPPAEPESEGDAPLTHTIAKEIRKTEKAVQAIGEGAVDLMSPVPVPLAGHAESKKRVIPDWTLPVQSFQAADVDVHWTVKRLSMPPVQMEDVIMMTTLKDGVLRVGPWAVGHHGAMTTGLLTVDGVSAVPQAGIELTTSNLDYGGMLKAFKVTNMVEGSADVTLAATGRGRTLRELAGTANGSLDIVAGPAKLASRFVELWASNLMTAMLSEAWHREKVSRYHCAAAYIDIENGEMKTDSLLIEASDHSVAAAGSLNLGTEELDMIVTPKPANLALLSLAAPIRLTGPLTAPKVSANLQSIAASKAWQVLDVADPVGLALLVPRVVLNENPAISSTDNPCTHALRKGGKEALSTQSMVSAGFTWFGDRLHETGRRATQLFHGPATSTVP